VTLATGGHADARGSGRPSATALLDALGLDILCRWEGA
jgi:hypothetical protein